MFPVDRMRELNFHRETAVSDSSFPVQGLVIRSSMPLLGRAQYNKVIKGNLIIGDVLFKLQFELVPELTTPTDQELKVTYR